ncbi:hypothetical protein Pcinc_036679 [Petrolisthes cinctipes]|uniref:Uncharacterized protein n=1 Tax=Petrolisthes cinctipes TaxID=88211 RepID=A0AAE1BV62_PETCI|nr:hypothetical protein Pcinc_036679 [Petrolisthes cinctipes]
MLCRGVAGVLDFEEFLIVSQSIIKISVYKLQTTFPVHNDSPCLWQTCNLPVSTSFDTPFPGRKMSHKEENLKEPPPPLVPLPILGEISQWVVQNDVPPDFATSFSQRCGLLEQDFLVNNDERNDGELLVNNDERNDGELLVNNDERNDGELLVNNDERNDGELLVNNDERNDGELLVNNDERNDGELLVNNDERNDGELLVNNDERNDGELLVNNDERNDGELLVNNDERNDGELLVNNDERNDGELLVNNDERNDGELLVNNDERNDGELLVNNNQRHHVDDNKYRENKFIDPEDLAIISEKWRRSPESKFPREWYYLENQPDPLTRTVSEESGSSNILLRRENEDRERQPSLYSNKQQNEDDQPAQNEDRERQPSPHSNKRKNEDDQLAQRKHRKDDSGGEH